MISAISASFLAASAAAITTSGFIPVAATENPRSPAPSTGSCEAKLAMLFSPANHAATPPSLGIVSAISAKDFAALAAVIMISGFIPVAAVENARSPAPNTGN